MRLQTFLKLFTVLSLLSAAPLAAQASETEVAVNDADFRTVAKKLRGFRMISNTPPLPDAKIFDGDFKPVSLKEFEGKALLINFWATWCTPCVQEMPDLNELQAELGGDKFQVVAIASGSQVGKNPDAFLKEYDLRALDLYLDPHASVMTMMGTKTLPTTLVVDRSGRILGGIQGKAPWASPEAKAILKHLIDG